MLRNLRYTLNTTTPAAASPTIHYELTNHLGNVMAVITDEPAATEPPAVESLTDYYPFGMTMPGRSYNAHTSRHGFTGHEKESDLAEGIYTTQYRLYDARVGRWLSVDPLFEKYVGMSPYNYCMLNPVMMVDLDGRQCNPFDYFDGYHFDYFGALNDEWESFKTGCSLRYNSWYNSKVHGNSTLLTSLLLTSEFIFSYGPELREFSNENFSEALKQSNMTTIALKAFQKGYDDYLKGERPIPETYRVDFSIFPGEGDTGPLNEFFEDGPSIAQFTGTCFYNFKIDGENLNISVYDDKTEYSLLYHIPGTDKHSRTENRFLGKTKQLYKFSIPLDEVKKRASEE